MKQLILFWFMVFLGLVLLESLTPGFFFFIAFSAGALGALGASMLQLPFEYQVVIFLVSSLIMFIMLRLLVRYAPFFKARPHQQTNFYALIGKQGFVVLPILPLKKGYVRIDGELWVACTDCNRGLTPRDETLPNGTIVEVIGVSGAHVIVKKTV
jgi:membrane protein implicated in regulation of membrane protease activity